MLKVEGRGVPFVLVIEDVYIIEMTKERVTTLFRIYWSTNSIEFQVSLKTTYHNSFKVIVLGLKD